MIKEKYNCVTEYISKSVEKSCGVLLQAGRGCLHSAFLAGRRGKSWAAQAGHLGKSICWLVGEWPRRDAPRMENDSTGGETEEENTKE